MRRQAEGTKSVEAELTKAVLFFYINVKSNEKQMSQKFSSQNRGTESFRKAEMATDRSPECSSLSLHSTESGLWPHRDADTHFT